MRGLGVNQRGVLESILRHGHWSAGCGWYWDTHSGTRRIVESLERRGLVKREMGEGYYGKFTKFVPVRDKAEEALKA